MSDWIAVSQRINLLNQKFLAVNGIVVAPYIRHQFIAKVACMYFVMNYSTTGTFSTIEASASCELVEVDVVSVFDVEVVVSASCEPVEVDAVSVFDVEIAVESHKKRSILSGCTSFLSTPKKSPSP